MTTEVNKPINLAENLFRDLVWNTLVESAIAALFTAVPWLNVWPIGSAVRYILKLFADKIFESVRLSLDLAVIAFLNNEHKKAYEAEAVKLKIIAHSYGIDSQQFKEEKERAKEALAKFVAYNR